MSFLENEITATLGDLYKEIIGNVGVGVCLKQGSCNFENWVQIEMCRLLLKKEFSSGFDIKIEEKGGPFLKAILNQFSQETSNYTDVLMSSKNPNERSVVIEIKIARLGDKSDVKIKRIKKDINKLTGFDKNKYQRILLCVVYKTNGNFEKKWGPLVPDNAEKARGDYQEDIKNI